MGTKKYPDLHLISRQVMINGAWRIIPKEFINSPLGTGDVSPDLMHRILNTRYCMPLRICKLQFEKRWFEMISIITKREYF